MASTGLSSLMANTGVQSTSLPSWYDTAQQNVVNQATAANAAAPAPQNTVAQNAVNALSGPTNAFTTAGNTLQNIASGASSPWNVDASGNVTPNTSTALGGLFQAQNQQLNALLPQTTGAVESGNIASGNFGSLRGQTAVDSARALAQSNLLSSQMNAALQNQATGVQAGSAAGNVAQQDINNLLTTGQYQQSSPYVNAANLGNILSGIQTGNTVSNTTNISPVNQVAGLVSLLGGSTGSGGVLGQLFGTPASGNTAATTGLLGTLSNYVGNLFNSGSSGTNTTGGLTDAQIQSIISGGGANTLTANNLNDMVSSGVITQAQSDAISAANQTNAAINNAYSGSTTGNTTNQDGV